MVEESYESDVKGDGNTTITGKFNELNSDINGVKKDIENIKSNRNSDRKEIESISKHINRFENLFVSNRKNKMWFLIFLSFSFIISITSLLIIMCVHYDFNLESVSLSTIITLISGLTLFVVVNNHLQLKRTEDRVDKFESEFDLKQMNLKIKTIESDIENIRKERYIKPTTEKINVDAISAQATVKEQNRLNSILLSSRAAKLNDSFAIELFNSGISVEECRRKIIEKKVENQHHIDGSHTAGLI
jgi:hypothetical protein